MFEKRDVEYVRALCIASFWLADASRIFSSDAIRRAADMRLHRSFDSLIGSRAPEIIFAFVAGSYSRGGPSATMVRDVLGSDNETQLPPALTHHITNYSRQLDKWFTKFSALFITNAYIGDFPRKGLELHYQFDVQWPVRQSYPDAFPNRRNMAHEAAVTIFEMILNESQLKEGLVGMPHYFHIMIAFAGHLLLEICNNHHEQLGYQLTGRAPSH
ncbi:hypothetical protein BBP40_002553 [Aspergillus hancockii]|nr:hypothetical protein BBP40_002553 [Aspergillus hancockii]